MPPRRRSIKSPLNARTQLSSGARNPALCLKHPLLQDIVPADSEGSYETIIILQECEVQIENSVPRVTVWHHEAALSSDGKQ